MGKANMMIAVIGTVLGFATSAVVAEVRGYSPEPAPVAAVSAPKQFRPAFGFGGPTFASTAAPRWQPSVAAATDTVATRSIVVTWRTAGVVR